METDPREAIAKLFVKYIELAKASPEEMAKDTHDVVMDTLTQLGAEPHHFTLAFHLLLNDISKHPEWVDTLSKLHCDVNC